MPIGKSVKLVFKNKDFLLVGEEDVPAARHTSVRRCHLELLGKIQGLTVWSPEETSDILFEYYGYLYKKVFSLLKLPCELEEVDIISLHLFLICTEPEGRQPGLSQLEYIMGYEYKTAEKEETNNKRSKKTPTTGNSILDIKTDLFLIFKEQAPLLWETQSLDQCALMSRQANERMATDNEEEEFVEDEEPGVDSPEGEQMFIPEELFQQHKSLITQELDKMGIIYPEGI